MMITVKFRHQMVGLWLMLQLFLVRLAFHGHLILALSDTMPLDSYLSASDNPSDTSHYVSGNGVFCFGFHSDVQPGKEGNYYLGVWYNNIDPLVFVWVAMQSDGTVPHVGTGSSAHLTSDGNLMMDVGAATGSLSSTWQTGTAGKGVDRLQILDSGNVALLNAAGGTVWQSFDSPSASTLLPGQKLAVGYQLQSESPAGRFSKGSFFLQTSPTLSLSYNPNGTSTSASYLSIANHTSGSVAFDDTPAGILRFYDGTGQKVMESRPSDYNVSGVLRRLKLDADGNMRMYSWVPQKSEWDVVWIAVADLCDVLTRADVSDSICGTYGICISYPGPTCVCPPGFEPKTADDISASCQPSDPSILSVPSPASGCSADQDGEHLTAVDYIQLDNTDYRENDIVSYSELSEKDCLQRCSESCNCYGVVYELSGSTSCYLKSGLENGLSPQNGHSTRASIKVYISPQNRLDWILPAGPPSRSGNGVTSWSANSYWTNSTAVCDAGGGGGGGRTAALVAAVAVAELVCFAILGFFVARRWRRRRRAAAVADAGGCKSFTYGELAEATEGFSRKLGAGAFGEVFKGRLSDGRAVAVKKLEEGRMARAEGQFRAEIATIGKIHHINLLRLYGYCAASDGPRHRRMLVYEYMENGSLDDALFSTSPKVELDWAARFHVCLGTARGLTYLHDECHECILHCDIKPQNILLDGGLNAKVADFGLAYLYHRDETTLKVSTIRGTRGYLAPEWLSNRPITAKADVFSYGMLVMEIISGRSNCRFTDSSLSDGKWDFPLWSLRRLQEGKVEQVMDPKLLKLGEVNYEQVRDLLHIALLCLQKDPAARPKMREITQMLEGIVLIPTFRIPSAAIAAFDYN